MHRVLRISTENAFCLHSKERVPFHIIIEVAYSPEQKKDEEEKIEDSERVTHGPDLTGSKSFKDELTDKQSGIWPV